MHATKKEAALNHFRHVKFQMSATLKSMHAEASRLVETHTRTEEPSTCQLPIEVMCIAKKLAESFRGMCINQRSVHEGVDGYDMFLVVDRPLTHRDKEVECLSITAEISSVFAETQSRCYVPMSVRGVNSKGDRYLGLHLPFREIERSTDSKWGVTSVLSNQTDVLRYILGMLV
jgi:hypothetical protein